MPQVACGLDTGRFFPINWHFMMPQRLVPEAFTLVQEPDRILRPGSYQVSTPPELTGYSAFFFWNQKLRYRQAIEDWPAQQVPPLTMARQWWKWLQLEVIHRGIPADAIAYALTLPAIERAIPEVGLEIPSCLAAMVTGMWMHIFAKMPLTTSMR